MKILFIFDRVTHYQKSFFSTLDESLRTKGYSLHLFSGNPKPNETGRAALSKSIIENQTSYRFYELALFSYTLRYQPNLISYVKDVNPDLIVVPGHPGNVTSWNLARQKARLNFRLYSWQCGFEYHNNRIKRALTTRYLSQFDHHLAYHTNAKRYLLSHHVNESRISVVFNTIDESKVPRLAKDKAKRMLAKSHPSTEGRKIVLFVGAILPEKRLDTLLDAFSNLRRDDSCLLIIGDGPYLSSLKGRTASTSNVIFTGKIINEAGQYFDAADIFVLPGTGGLAINEAMAHGLPVISGYADGRADDLVLHGETGFRIEEDTGVNGISSYLSVLLNDAGLRQQLGESARALMNEKYSFRSFIDRVITALVDN